jgi:CBS domain-containing protein
MINSPKVISPETPVEEAAELMDRFKITGLPVIDGKTAALVGFVSQNELIALCSKFTSIPITNIMAKIKVEVTPEDRLIHARKIMFDEKFGSLLVTDGGQVVGVISEGSLARYFANFRISVPARHQEERIRSILVKDAMKQLDVHLSPQSTVADAANMMLEKGVRALPVIDENSSLVGLITKGDLTRFIAKGFK